MGLPVGAQERMIAAARFAALCNWRINHHLTVRWDGLRYCHAETKLVAARVHWADATTRFLERLRKFLSDLGAPWAAIWRRECSGSGEHLHIALHLSDATARALTTYLAKALGEAVGDHVPADLRGVVALSESRNWLLQRDDGDGPDDWANEGLVAYLGKGEPDEVRRRGRGWGMRENERKPRRKGRYAYRDQRPIEGTAKRTLAFGIVKPIAEAAQKRIQNAACAA